MFVGTSLTISGWGTIASNGPQSADLKVAAVTGLSNTDCNKVYSGITSNMICAGTANFDTDTCQGDSGGEPLKFFITKRTNDAIGPGRPDNITSNK